MAEASAKFHSRGTLARPRRRGQRVTGHPYITGFHPFVVDPDGPFPAGFRVGSQAETQRGRRPGRVPRRRQSLPTRPAGRAVVRPEGANASGKSRLEPGVASQIEAAEYHQAARDKNPFKVNAELTAFPRELAGLPQHLALEPFLGIGLDYYVGVLKVIQEVRFGPQGPIVLCEH